jgi:hypothetical protein
MCPQSLDERSLHVVGEWLPIAHWISCVLINPFENRVAISPLIQVGFDDFDLDAFALRHATSRERLGDSTLEGSRLHIRVRCRADRNFRLRFPHLPYSAF